MAVLPVPAGLAAAFVIADPASVHEVIAIEFEVLAITTTMRSEDAVPIAADVTVNEVASVPKACDVRYVRMRGGVFTLPGSMPIVKGMARRCLENSMLSGLMIAGFGGSTSLGFGTTSSLATAAARRGPIMS
jgi:hypothetical protein